MTVTDLHQHLWPEPFVRGLAARTAPPRLRRSGGAWVLELAGEPPSVVDLQAHDPEARAIRAARDWVERVVVAPSSPLGVESLPPDEAQPLLDAFHAGVLELGPPFALWASLPLAAALPEALEDLLDAGAVGLCLPAAAVAAPRPLERLAPVLERLAARGAPLLVHPGPAPAGAGAMPPWWGAMTSYAAELQTAWMAWAAWGRPAHPRLKVVWAMLAGGAPLHAERLLARGGPAGALHDDLAWFDVSSYGPRAVDAMLRAVGVDRLVLGSDRPVIEPPSLDPLGTAVWSALAEDNPCRILDPLVLAA